MATSQISEMMQQLRTAVLLRDGAGLTDGQLLEDYLSRRDEAALAALIHRHGPMVWGVCRRVLSNHHDAEDAFQATFLVLVRKAASIAAKEMVANWLYGVAHRTALQARRTVARRKKRERQVVAMPEPAVAGLDLWDDLQPLLDQELSRLPDKYRVPIVLCDLEGKTYKEAARQLGCPEGTLSARLARGRQMLAKRLARHGLAVSGGTLAAVLSQKASAGVPPAVVSSTIKAVSLFAAGPAATTGAISAQVVALAEGMPKTMLLTKLKVVIVLLLAATLSGAAGLFYQTEAAEQPKAQAVTKQGDNDKPSAADKPAARTDLDRLQGEWKLEDVEIGGRTDPDLKELKKIKWVIKGDKITMGKGDDRDATGSVKVDSTKRPKEIDITLTAGDPPADHKTYPGIYKLDGDKLTVCYVLYPEDGQSRPTDFNTKDGAYLVVLVHSAQEKATGSGDKERPPAIERRDADDLKETVLALQKRIWEANAKQDLAVMKSLLADDFVGLDKNGNLFHKRDELRYVSEWCEFDHAMKEAMVILLNDSSALVIYEVRYKVRSAKSQEVSSSESRQGTGAWAKRNGRWWYVYKESHPVSPGKQRFVPIEFERAVDEFNKALEKGKPK